MTVAQHIVAILLVVSGLAMMFSGGIGLIRLPDFYTRTHAASKVDTLGIVLLLLGLAVYEGFTLNAAKLLMGAVVIMLGNPVAVHALARAARGFGHLPWENTPGKTNTNKTQSTDALDS